MACGDWWRKILSVVTKLSLWLGIAAAVMTESPTGIAQPVVGSRSAREGLSGYLAARRGGQGAIPSSACRQPATSSSRPRLLSAPTLLWQACG